MKKFTKILLATLLVVCLCVSTFAFTGVFSHAQNMQEGVYVEISGTNTWGEMQNDWVTIGDNNAIQDSNLKFTIFNETPTKYGDDETKANKPIIITKYESNATLNLNGDTELQKVEGGTSHEVQVTSGSIAPEQILWIRITYYVEGTDADLTETCTARIYATRGNFYNNAPGNRNIKIDKNWYKASFQWNADCYAYPVTAETENHTSTATREGSSALGLTEGIAVNQSCTDQHATYTIRLDISRFKDWKSFGLNLGIKGDTVRDEFAINEVSINQSKTSSGSIKICEVASSPDQPSVHEAYVKDTNPIPWLKLACGSLQSVGFEGNIPQECVASTSSAPTFTVSVGMIGIAGWDFTAGAVSRKTAQAFFNMTFNVLGVNKDPLRQDLIKYTREGLNKDAYESSSWTTYENALNEAYKALALTSSTISSLNSAKTSLKNAHDNLKRLAVVYTNYYYYEGLDNSNPVLFKTDIKRNQLNSTATETKTFTPNPLGNGTYTMPIPYTDEDGTVHDTSTRQINRSAADNALARKVEVGEDTNYTMYVDMYYWYVDEAPLRAAIKTYDDNFNNADPSLNKQYDEDGNLVYTTDSWNKYTKAVAAGRSVLADNTVFEYDYRLATEQINTTYLGLRYDNPATPWLDEGIRWAEQLMGCNVENIEDLQDVFTDEGNRGYDWRYNTIFSSTYAAEKYSDLEEAYYAAKELQSGNYTARQAKVASDNLWNAIKALRIRDDVTKGLYRDKNYHADVDNYGWIKSVVPSALNRNNGDYGLRKLYNAIIERADSVPIDKANNVYMDFTKLDPANFTQESWEDLLDAMYGERDSWEFFDDLFTDLSNFNYEEFYEGIGCTAMCDPYEIDDGVNTELDVPAFSMINNIWFLASQADYNACRDNLLDKVNNLVWVVDTAALEEAVASANEVEADLYTRASFEPFAQILEAANTALENTAEDQLFGDPNATTQDVIDALVEELSETISNLKLKPTLEPYAEEVNLEDGILTGETAGATVESVLADLKVNNNSADVERKIYDRQGNEVALGAKVGTGYKVVLQSVGEDKEIYQEETIVIKGDVLGNASVTEDDCNLVFNYSFSKTGIEKDSIFMMAADVNGDGKVNLTDAMLINIMAHKA